MLACCEQSGSLADLIFGVRVAILQVRRPLPSSWTCNCPARWLLRGTTGGLVASASTFLRVESRPLGTFQCQVPEETHCLSCAAPLVISRVCCQALGCSACESAPGRVGVVARALRPNWQWASSVLGNSPSRVRSGWLSSLGRARTTAT